MSNYIDMIMFSIMCTVVVRRNVFVIITLLVINLTNYNFRFPIHYKRMKEIERDFHLPRRNLITRETSSTNQCW